MIPSGKFQKFALAQPCTHPYISAKLGQN